MDTAYKRHIMYSHPPNIHVIQTQKSLLAYYFTLFRGRKWKKTNKGFNKQLLLPPMLHIAMRMCSWFFFPCMQKARVDDCDFPCTA